MDDHVAKTVAVYDAIADDYSISMNAYTPQTERKKFLSYLSKGRNVLDVGCASGRDSIYFQKHDKNVTGVDLSGRLLSIARKRAPEIKFFNKDIRQLDFKDAYFDGIWACAVLLHLKRDEVASVIKDCFKLLKKDGILFLMMKKGVGEKDIREKLSSNVSRHFTLFRPEELAKIVTEAGFKIIENYTWNSKDRYDPPRDVEWISVFARK